MNDTQIKNAGGEKALFLKPETFELIRTAARGVIVPDKDQFLLEKRGNQSAFSLIYPPPENPEEGDMSYFYDGKWLRLPAPTNPGAVLYHDGTRPVWLEAVSAENTVLTSDGTNPSWTIGGTADMIFQDCTAAEVARISWTGGVLTTNSDQTVETGCDGTSSP